MEVLGTLGTNKPVGKVASTVAGKHVTAAVIEPVESQDCLIAFRRAIAADTFNGDILRQFDVYADLIGELNDAKYCLVQYDARFTLIYTNRRFHEG